MRHILSKIFNLNHAACSVILDFSTKQKRASHFPAHLVKSFDEAQEVYFRTCLGDDNPIANTNNIFEEMF